MNEQEQSTQPSLPIIGLNDRVAVFGGTGSGKSILAQVLYRSLPKQWHKIIIDTTDSVIEPSALDFYDPNEIPWDKAWNLRFVPDIELLDEEVNTLYTNAFYHGACFIWLDEGNEVSTAHRTVPGLRRVLLQGRKAMVGHLTCTPRPADISVSITSQSQYIIVFSLVNYDDRVRVAKNIGLQVDEFDEYMSQLEEYQYLFYDVAMHDLFKCDAIPDEIVQRILTPPKKEVTEYAHP